VRLSRSAAVVSGATGLILLPFVGKAFHVDDTQFLWVAHQIQAHPSDFFGFAANWYGYQVPMYQIVTNPPLAPYYMALVASVAGWNEVTLHLAFLAVAMGAAVGTCVLARRFCTAPAVAALAGVLTPAFVVSSTNTMCDTLLVGLMVWAIVLWTAGLERRRAAMQGGAALLTALAALTKYVGVGLLPLLLVYTVAKRRRLTSELLWLGVPVAILGAYDLYTTLLYGRGLFFEAVFQASNTRARSGLAPFRRGLIGLAFTGGCLATVALYAPLLWSRRALGAGLVVAAALVIPAARTVGGYPAVSAPAVPWVIGQLDLLAVAGLSVLALAIADLWHRRDADSLLLVLWVTGGFVFASFVNSTINARSILLIAPVSGILIARRLEARPTAPRAGWTWAPLLAGGCLALTLAAADYTLAGAGRTAAGLIWANYGHLGRTVWFQGHWGFQYYMEAAGARPFDLMRLGMHPGDLMILPDNNTNVLFPLPGIPMSLLRPIELPSPRWLTTLQPWLGAGFYSELVGPLPFAFGPVPPERYYVAVIGPPAAAR
jgi:4-amino-4-deoxy-L-arabinose transferase-like glycosyltransferase